MRFSKLLIGIATGLFNAILAAPIKVTAVAGSVLTDKGLTYDMVGTNGWIKAFDQQVDNGRYPRPVSSQVHGGYHCIFYTESNRGAGHPFGEFVGPTLGTLEKWVAFYKCWVVGMAVTSRDTSNSESRLDDEQQIIPTGYSVDDKWGQQYTLDTGKNPPRLANFAVMGEKFSPEAYGVNEHCTCWYYSAHDGRGGSERVLAIDGPANGNFTGTAVTRYACWRHD